MARSQELTRLFQQPTSTTQRRYEICRAYFVDQTSAADLARPGRRASASRHLCPARSPGKLRVVQATWVAAKSGVSSRHTIRTVGRDRSVCFLLVRGSTHAALLLFPDPPGSADTGDGDRLPEQTDTGPGAEAPVIPVSRPVRRPVQDFVDYTGRTAAVQALDVRARVTGYLVQIPFKEGAEVKKGDPLFEIDPRPYQAQVDAAEAQVAVNQANYNLARANYARSRAIAARDATAISPQDLETAQATEAQGLRQRQPRQGPLRYQLSLDWTRVTAPIDGQISRYYLTLGNLVTADQTLLTTIVSVDPLYVYFDMDERTVLNIRSAINAGIITPHEKTSDIPVWMGLEHETGYPHHGVSVSSTIRSTPRRAR